MGFSICVVKNSLTEFIFEQGFHSDNGDNVSLYCRQVAASGGELYLSSSWTIYNALATHRKDVMRVLANPWLWQVSRLYDVPFQFVLPVEPIAPRNTHATSGC